MKEGRLRYVFLGLSLTSSYGQGHASTYRALLRELAERGHQVVFLEREQPLEEASRDLPQPAYARLERYGSLEELRDCHRPTLRQADLVVVGSRVPQGIALGRWVLSIAEGPTAFYDLDTPDTLAELERGVCSYLRPALIPCYSAYLSFTGGPTLRLLERAYGAPMARALHCAVDPRQHHPLGGPVEHDLGYVANHASDRQAKVEALLLGAARGWPGGRFAMAGSGYPTALPWPTNVIHRGHLGPAELARFYAAQRFTLNLTRRERARRGYSPSARLFEAAACGIPIISDPWPGLADFFVPGEEILIAEHAHQVLDLLRHTSESQREQVAQRARRRVLAEHTAARRAETLEALTRELLERRARRRRCGSPAASTRSTAPAPAAVLDEPPALLAVAHPRLEAAALSPAVAMASRRQ